MTPDDIDRSAPILAHHRTVIQAPLSLVWRLHTDVEAWPTWQTDIAWARLTEPFVPGTTFTWHTAGLDVASTLYQIEPERHTLWGGPAHGIDGIHAWNFTQDADGVQVSTEESWRGAALEGQVPQMQSALDSSLVRWLQHLKSEAEWQV